MEEQVVVFAVAVAAASLGVAVFVLLRVVKLNPSIPRRVVSTPGFRWFMLGVIATMAFVLLELSPVIPLLVLAGGLLAVGIDIYRRWKNRP